MKIELRIFVGFAVFIISFLAFSYSGEKRLPTSSLSIFAILTLLGAVIILLWRALKLLYGLADKLGYMPARTERIEALMKKLHPTWSSTSKLTDVQRKQLDEELAELAEHDFYSQPANSGQMRLIIGHLQKITDVLTRDEKPPTAS